MATKKAEIEYLATGRRKTAIAREIYCSILLDREANSPVLVLSAEGGMEIEEIAEKHPEKLLKMHPPVGHDLWSFQVLRAVKINTGVLIAAARHCANTSSPESPGKPKSRIIKS